MRQITFVMRIREWEYLCLFDSILCAIKTCEQTCRSKFALHTDLHMLKVFYMGATLVILANESSLKTTLACRKKLYRWLLFFFISETRFIDSDKSLRNSEGDLERGNLTFFSRFTFVKNAVAISPRPAVQDHGENEVNLIILGPLNPLLKMLIWQAAQPQYNGVTFYKQDIQQIRSKSYHPPPPLILGWGLGLLLSPLSNDWLIYIRSALLAAPSADCFITRLMEKKRIAEGGGG